MKTIFIFFFIVLISSCESIKEEPEIDEVIQTPIDKETEPELEEMIHHYDVFTFDKNLYSTPSIDVYTNNFQVPLVLKGELFIEEYFPEDKILRLIALKKHYFTFNKLTEGGFLENEVTAIFSKNNSYYIGTRRGGLFRYILENDDFSVIKLPDNTLHNRSITGILSYEDRILISSYSGLFSYDPISETIEYLSDNFPNRGFISICKVNDIVYLGTARGSIYTLDSDNLKFIKSIGNAPVSLISFVNEYIVVGISGAGLFIYTPENDSIEPINVINDQLEDKRVNVVAYFDGLYYVATFGDGLLSFYPNLERKKMNQSNISVISTAQSRDIIYFGTHRDGLLFYDRIEGIWNNWGFSEGLSSLYIPAIYYYEENIYLSIPDRGIVIINEQIHEKNL